MMLIAMILPFPLPFDGARATEYSTRWSFCRNWYPAFVIWSRWMNTSFWPESCEMKPKRLRMSNHRTVPVSLADCARTALAHQPLPLGAADGEGLVGGRG